MPLSKEQNRIYQNNWLKKRRTDWIESQGGKCVKCESTIDLCVDHINPDTKKTHRIWGWTKFKRDEELAKCQVLCFVCHLEKTREENRVRGQTQDHGYIQRNQDGTFK